MAVTTLEMLQKVKENMFKEVELPPFSDGTPLVVEIKDIDMMKLVTTGKLPNTLLQEASTLFNKKSKMEDVEASILNDDNKLKEVMLLMDTVVENVLVKPTLKDFKKVGIEMTWEQKLALFSQVMGGSEMLSTFREESECFKSDKSSN